MNNNYNLTRFIKEQQRDYPNALAEIKNGRKRSHWMWYIFPQVKGLGFSSTSLYYGLDGVAEAKAYLENAYLRENLFAICQALLQLESCDAEAIFGYPDHLKLRSSMTIFELAMQDEAAMTTQDGITVAPALASKQTALKETPAPESAIFQQVLDKFFDGELDKKTIEIVKG